MAQPDLWGEAIEQLDKEDKSQIRAHNATKKLTILDDVLSSAKERQAECEGKQLKYKKQDGTEIELHKIFDKVVQKLVKFKVLGDSVAALDPTHLAIPWAAVSLVLQIAVNHSAYYQIVYEGIEMFAVFIPRYTIFENLYLRHDSQIKGLLEGEIVKLYANSLKYMAKAKAYYAMGTAERITKALFRVFDEFKDLMEGIRAQQVIVDDLARLIDAEYSHGASHSALERLPEIQEGQDVLRRALHEFHSPIQSINDGMIDLVNNLKKSQEKEILNWLSPISHNGYHQRLQTDRLKDSGLWIFDQEDYRRWRISSNSSLLWLHGFPGTGKSTLMSIIIDSIRANQANEQGGPLAYVYCSRNGSDRQLQDPESVIRCIIKQLARPGPNAPIRGIVVQKYQDLQEERYGGADLSWLDTKDLLLQLVDQGTTTIFIDAIDECTADRWTEFAGLIGRVLNDAKGRVKILISSRPSSDISARFKSLQCYSVDAGHNRDDIKRYAQLKATECVEGMKLRGIPVSENLQEILAERLVNGAQGMFLWVRLQVGILSDSGQTIFEEDLLRPREPPNALFELYSTIYNRIDGSGRRTRETAVTLFRWLLCAEASVSKDELINAISIHLNAISIHPPGKGDRLTESMILDSCRNLVMIDDDLNTFRFIHTSVKDFLEGQPKFNLKESHATVAEVCMRMVQEMPDLQEPFLRRDSLHCYVVLYWASHIEQAGQQPRTEMIQDALNSLCVRGGHAQPWFGQWLPQIEPVSQILDWNDPFKDKILQALSSPETSFFTACAFGFAEVVEHYSQARPELVRKANAMGATGLHLACQYGHLTIAETLLGASADIDAKDNYSETPLVRASSGGHDSLVQLLLKKGANAKIQGRRFGTSLQAAALYGHLGVVKNLVGHGVDIEAEGGQFGTALQAASLRGHVRVVNYLITSGADINAPGGDYETVYQTAPNKAFADGVRRAVEYVLEQQRLDNDDPRYPSEEAKNESAVQLLLDRNLDINLKKGGFGPAIQAASRSGHEKVVAALLGAKGVDVNIEGGRYGSALQAAAISGSEAIMRTLLKAKADINIQNGTYGTALIAACRQSYYELAEFLLHEGAAVNAQAGVYGTALQAAARAGNSHLVQLLLDHGADVNLTGGKYCTALQAAALDGYEHIIQILLQHSADVNIEGGSFGTALQAAAGAGHLKSVQMLVEKNAQLGNALQVGCLGGHQDIVDFLLAHGADLNAQSIAFGSALQAATDHDEKMTRSFPSPLECAATAGHEDVVKLLLGTPRLSQRSSEVRYARKMALDAASQSGYLNVVRLLVDAETSSNDLGTALSNATEGNHEETVQFLLSKGATVDSDTFSTACCKGSTNMVESFLQQWGSLAGRRMRKYPLFVASFHGRMDIVRMLLQNGAEVNQVTTMHDMCTGTALHAAVSGGHEEIVNLLLESNADITIQSEEHGTVLQVASSRGHTGIVKALLDRNADVNIVSGKYGTALQASAYAGSEEVVRELLEKDVDVNFEGGMFGTALQAAASQGHETIVQLLLDAGADVRKQGGEPEGWKDDDTSRWWKVRLESFAFFRKTGPARRQNGMFGTALQAAAAGGNVEIVRLLLDNGADIKDIDKFGQTPLHRAAYHGHEAVVAFLLERGASADVQDFKGRSSILLAASSGWKRIFTRLSAAGAESDSKDRKGQTALHRAASNGHLTILQQLIAQGFDIEQKDEQGRTALLVAAESGRCSTVRFLLDHESKINHRGDGDYTALHVAADHGHDAVARLLLTRGANIHAQDDSGGTALHHAANHNQSKVLYLLAEQGAKLDMKDNNENTALHYAALKRSREMVAILLDKGANVESRDSEGQTPLHCSVLYANPEPSPLAVIQLLAQRGADMNAKTTKGRTFLEQSNMMPFEIKGIEKDLARLGIINDEDGEENKSEGYEIDNEYESDEYESEWYESGMRVDFDSEDYEGGEYGTEDEYRSVEEYESEEEYESGQEEQGEDDHDDDNKALNDQNGHLEA